MRVKSAVAAADALLPQETITATGFPASAASACTRLCPRVCQA